MTKKSLADWLDQLFSNIITAYRGPLTRIQQVADQLQLQSLAPHVITVTGTNGKGSTVHLLEAIYQQAGYRVATMTSPHIRDFCERVRFNGRVVTEAAVVSAFERVAGCCDLKRINTFDFIFVSLLWCIKQQQPEVVILEAGIGGLHDVTNLIDADAAVITTIALDHTDLLGPTREDIAFHKVHLARRGRPLICGDPQPPANVALLAQELGAKLWQQGVDFFYESEGTHWQWWTAQQRLQSLPRPSIKLQNAASAVMTVMQLQQQLPVSEADIREALATLQMPGRFQTVQRQCPIVLDVAHNPEACHWLAEQLRERPVAGQTWVVMGMSLTKDFRASLAAMLPGVDRWWLAPLKGRSSHPACELQQELEALGAKNCYTSEDLAAALAQALSQATEQDRIVVCGSFSAVQEAMEYLGERSW